MCCECWRWESACNQNKFVEKYEKWLQRSTDSTSKLNLGVHPNAQNVQRNICIYCRFTFKTFFIAR